MQKLKTGEDIRNLLYSAAPAAALSAAIETGLLWQLQEKPGDHQAVARSMNIPVRRCAYWLQMLLALGILEETTEGYAPSALAKRAILDIRSRESWQHLVEDERERTDGVQKLAQYLSEPGSIWLAQGMPASRYYVNKMRTDYKRAREFARMLYEVHQYLGRELAELLDLRGARRMMDLGGNSGVVSIALLRKYPELTSTIVDIENICVAGREIVAENGLSDRITYVPLDFEADELPGGFDLILKCDVSIFTTELWRKMYAALNTGGRLVVVESLSPSEFVPPPKRLAWSFLDSLENPDFATPTIEQLRALMVQTGFTLLPGEHTLSDQRVVVQGRK